MLDTVADAYNERMADILEMPFMALFQLYKWAQYRQSYRTWLLLVTRGL